MIDRRRFIGSVAGVSATLALTPEWLQVLHTTQGQLIQRRVPSTGEMLPVIGVARGNVQNNARLAHLVDMVDPSSEAYAMLKAVVRTMGDNGGRVIDSSAGYIEGQQVTGRIAEDLGIQDRVFWSTGVPLPLSSQGTPPPDATAVQGHLEAVFARLKVPTVDLIMVPASSPSAVSALPTILGVLRKAKEDGRIRYIGVSELPTPNNPYATLEALIRSEPLDFIGLPGYHIGNRRAEETILPLAQDRRVGVMTYGPFDLGRLFQRVGATPVPEWADDFGARTWAQFFLKYIVSHPAVTVVLPGTSSATHMLDNIGGGVGTIPNDAARTRMAALVDSLPIAQAPVQATGRAHVGAPVVVSAAVLDSYAGEYRMASSPASFVFRRAGAALFVSPSPSSPLIARSETIFSFDAPEPVFEFQFDAEGRVTGVILEQRGQRTLLVRN